MAVAGNECSFDHGREQLNRLAGLNLKSKAVERHAEAIGPNLAATQQAEMERTVQLEFPEILGGSCAGALHRNGRYRSAGGAGGNGRLEAHRCHATLQTGRFLQASLCGKGAGNQMKSDVAFQVKGNLKPLQ